MNQFHSSVAKKEKTTHPCGLSISEINMIVADLNKHFSSIAYFVYRRGGVAVGFRSRTRWSAKRRPNHSPDNLLRTSVTGR